MSVQIGGREAPRGGGRSRPLAVEAIPSEMAARKRKRPTAAPRRATRSLLGARPSLPHLDLEPHQLDIVALALIAIGIFLAGVAYLHWSGGAVGEGTINAFRFMIGALGYAVPAALVLGGALVLMRELRPPTRPIRTGAVCLTAALTLALAAGTLGIGPGRAVHTYYWQSASMKAHGGILGQAELRVVSQ